MKDSPFFSIITPTYNRGQMIERCIKSVSTQDFGDWEMIIVDDGSTDNTSEVIAPYLNDKRIKYLQKENGGCNSSRVVGVANASGEYFHFLDSDDEFLPGKLSRIWEAIQEDQSFDIWVNDTEAMKVGEGLIPAPSIYSENIQEDFAYKRIRWPINSVTWKRAFYQQIGGFPEHQWCGTDWFIHMKALSAKPKVKYIHEKLNRVNVGHFEARVTRSQDHKKKIDYEKATFEVRLELRSEPFDFSFRSYLFFYYLRALKRLMKRSPWVALGFGLKNFPKVILFR